MPDFPVLNPKDRRLIALDAQGAPLAPVARASIRVAFTDLREKPDRACGIDTQLLFGEPVRVFSRQGDWTLVQAERDSYVGWLETATLSDECWEPTHLVCVPRTFFYPDADLKLPHKGMRSMGSAVRIAGEVENRSTRYAVLETGEAVVSKHLTPVSQTASDYVSVCETLLRTPYLWAGTSAFGIDCSGLVKLAMLMCGYHVLRDSDMQAATLGTPFDPGPGCDQLVRGDLVFWKGHVAVCQGPDQNGTQHIIHANGHSMDVTCEPLSEAIDRIAYLYAEPIGFRRPGIQPG